VRATKFGGKWRVQSKTSDEIDWTYHDPPLLDDLLKLKDVIARNTNAGVPPPMTLSQSRS